MADPRVRILKIKIGVVKRLTKEKLVYLKEAEQQKQRIEKIKAEGKDEYDIKKQEEVLQEALMMVPDCQRRLAKAYEELKNIVDNESDLKELEGYSQAVQVLEEARAELASGDEPST